jgi:hypothetical protein
MTEEMFNLILQIGTYNGEACYTCYEDMEKDYKAINSVSLTPPEVKRLVNTAYLMGKNENKGEEE